jgi:hypothetical protein
VNGIERRAAVRRLISERSDAARAFILQIDHMRLLGARVTDQDRRATNEAEVRYTQATRRLRAIT